MGSHSRLLIEEVVLPDKGADWLSAAGDVIMLFLPAGLERTETHFRTMIQKAGLEVVKVWNREGQLQSVLETRLA